MCVALHTHHNVCVCVCWLLIDVHASESNLDSPERVRPVTVVQKIQRLLSEPEEGIESSVLPLPLPPPPPSSLPPPSPLPPPPLSPLPIPPPHPSLCVSMSVLAHCHQKSEIMALLAERQEPF